MPAQHRKFYDASRIDWGRNVEKLADFTIQEDQLGALFRIAIAVERLVQIFECVNFQRIPTTLRRISRNTYRNPKRKKKP